MHVLGTPPAFILSQDQTLHRIGRGRCVLSDLLDRCLPTTLRLLRRPQRPDRSARSAARTFIIRRKLARRQPRLELPGDVPRGQKTHAPCGDLGVPIPPADAAYRRLAPRNLALLLSRAVRFRGWSPTLPRGLSRGPLPAARPRDSQMITDRLADRQGSARPKLVPAAGSGEAGGITKIGQARGDPRLDRRAAAPGIPGPARRRGGRRPRSARRPGRTA